MEQRRSALVTGGGSGIGLAIARALLGRGLSVAICGRDEARLRRAEAALASPRLLVRRADVSSEADVRAWVADTVERVGPPGLLVNNAAVLEEGELADTATASWERTLAVNLTGAFLCAREVLPHMQAGGGGYIVNISSLAGTIGMPCIGAYTASKFGLVGLTETLIREGREHRIRATAICPGMVATDMAWPPDAQVAELIQPEDVAATVLYLLDLSPAVVVPQIVLKRLAAV